MCGMHGRNIPCCCRGSSRGGGTAQYHAALHGAHGRADGHIAMEVRIAAADPAINSAEYARAQDIAAIRKIKRQTIVAI